jgi:hypothetical protein
MLARGGLVELTPSRGSKLTMILNREPERPLGVGGYESTERSQRRPAKWWKTIPDDTMTLDCTIDIDAVGGPSVERRIEVLRDMGLAGDEDAPPVITLDGDVWANDKGISWVIQTNGLTLGPRLYNSDGTLRRQQVTVSLERFTETPEIEPLTIRRTRAAGGSRRRRRVVRTRGNDTLRAVALRELGDQGRWKDLRSWNRRLKSTDPDVRLRPGLQITIR